MAAHRKLRDEQYAEIARAYLSQESVVSIAERYGMSVSIIRWWARRLNLPNKGYRNKRQQVIQASIDNPHLGPVAIAKLVGANRNYTIRIRSECGFSKRRNIASVSAPTLNQGGLQGLSQ